jgi:thiol-disulfide isomerase/thioredoxin
MSIVKFNSLDDDYKTKVAQIQDCLKKDTVVFVHAIWCPHCVSMKEDWELLKQNSRKGINFIEIESANVDRIRNANKMLFKKLYSEPDRVYYPLIKIWKDKKGSVYENERSFPIMKETIKKHFATKNKVKKSKQQKGGSELPTNEVKKFQRELNNYIKNILSNIR